MTAIDADFVKQVKRLVSDPLCRIELDELVRTELEAALASTSTTVFPLGASFAPEVASDRVSRMLFATARLRTLAILMSRWGNESNKPTLQRIFSRMADANSRSGGINGWIALSWFPFVVVSYVTGVAAFAAGRYDSLAAMLRATHWRKDSADDHHLAYCHAFGELMGAGRDAFKALPAYRDRRVALSDLLADSIRLELASLIGVDKEFDQSFDQFEVIQTLSFASDLNDGQHFWGLHGRFAYKEGSAGGPFARVQSAAELNGSSWGPVVAGLFGGDINRFRAIAKQYREEVLPRLRQM